MPASSGNGKGVCYVEGYSERLAGDKAKNGAQLMKSLAGFDKDVKLGSEMIKFRFWKMSDWQKF